MEKKKMKQLQECQEHRNHIPDDLFLMIFAKISDANCLCRLSLLSKRFPSLIARTPTGTFTVKVNWVNPFCNMIPPVSREHPFPFNFFTNPVQSLFRPDNPINEELFISLGRFLKHFDSIRSLHFQLLLSGYKPVTDPIVKWRIKFLFQRPKHFLIFSAKSITDYNQEEEESDEDEDENDNVKSELSEVEKIWVQEFAQYHMINAYARYLGLGIMVREGVNIREAKITDSDDYGEIVVSKNKIVELKNPMRDKIGWEMYWGFYYIPKLRLPHSGVVLKEVKIGLMRSFFHDKEDVNSDVVIDDGPEEYTVLGEVFLQLYLADGTYPSFADASYTVREDIP